jgi:hypothetical protein
LKKDGFFDKFWRNAAKIGFGVGLDLASQGKALTIGNALTALKKKPDDRSDVEKQFDDMIDKSKKAGKTRTLWQHICVLNKAKNGDHVTVTGDSPIGVFTVDFALSLK